MATLLILNFPLVPKNKSTYEYLVHATGNNDEVWRLLVLRENVPYTRAALCAMVVG